jgi:hypothetical protein
MRWLRLVPAVGAVIVLVVAFIGYERYIPIHHVERGRLSRLVVTAPPAGFKAKPTAAEVPASSSPFAALKTAATHSPNNTGSYSLQWTGSATSTDVASLLASWLPDAAAAATVQGQAGTTYLATASFKTDSYSLLSHFSVPQVAGAQGATFGPAKGATPRLAVVVFRQGRIVVVDYAQQATAAKAVAAATSLAQVESTHLKQVGSGFTLKVTIWPLTASLIYAGVAVALAALVVVVPIGVSRGRRHRRLAREAAARRALQGRGRKIAKHQAARHR